MIIYRNRNIRPGVKLGPVLEDETIQITCKTIGGWPIPKVTWWENGRKLDSEMKTLGSRLADDVGIVLAILTIKATREMVDRTLVCHAHTNDKVIPKTTAILLDITCKYMLNTLMLFGPYWVKGKLA